jgi:DNA-binding beta-propeller fold protein YncE
MEQMATQKVNSTALGASPLITRTNESLSLIANHRVQAFNRADLKHLYSVGSEGKQLGEFQYPRGLCIQPFTNHLLVCDRNNNRVQVFSTSSSSDQGYQPLKAIGSSSGEESAAKGEFNQPCGVCCAPDGSIVVAENENSRIQQFDASGRFVHTFGREGSGPQDLSSPFDVCHLDRRFAPSSSASSLLVVVDSDNKRVVMWSADGRQVVSQYYVGIGANGVCVDLNGFVNVSVSGYLKVVKIYDPRRNGGSALLQELGGERGSGPGQFNAPRCMCVDDINTLMVVDSNNHRVQFFD